MEKQMESGIFILVAIFLPVITSQGNAEHLGKVYGAPKGEVITLACPITLTSELSILRWKRDGRTVLSFQDSNDPSSRVDKYGLVGNTSLMITDVDRSDVGSYSCQVFLNDGGLFESDAIPLYVTELSVSHCNDNQIFDNKLDDCDCRIDGNSTTNLTCTAIGFPHEPDITWELGDRIRLESSVINLRAYSQNMTFSCRAEDPVLSDLTVNGEQVCVFYHEYVPDQDIEPNKPFHLVRLFLIVFIIIIVIIIIIGVVFFFLKKRSSRSCPSCCKSWCNTKDRRTRTDDQNIWDLQAKPPNRNNADDDTAPDGININQEDKDLSPCLQNKPPQEHRAVGHVRYLSSSSSGYGTLDKLKNSSSAASDSFHGSDMNDTEAQDARSVALWASKMGNVEDSIQDPVMESLHPITTA